MDLEKRRGRLQEECAALDGVLKKSKQKEVCIILLSVYQIKLSVYSSIGTIVAGSMHLKMKSTGDRCGQRAALYT